MADGGRKKKDQSTLANKITKIKKRKRAAAKLKAIICPKCGQEMDIAGGGVMNCGDCGWTITRAKKG